MAKDDYDVLVLYLLKYLYRCVRKGEIVDPDKVYFCDYPAKIEESYIIFILRQLYQKGFISGIEIIYVSDKISKDYIINDIENVEITSDGIEYLLNDRGMEAAWNKIVAAGGLIFSAIQALN